MCDRTLSAIFFKRLNHILMNWSVQAIKDVFKYRKDLHLLREDDLAYGAVRCLAQLLHILMFGFFPPSHIHMEQHFRRNLHLMHTSPASLK